MNHEQIKLLNKMKKLIYENRRQFCQGKDRDYLEDLMDFGLTEDEAWNEHIIYLNSNLYFPDPKPNYSKGKESALTFKKPIAGKIAYIKLKLETGLDGMETVCISFHEDNKKGGMLNEVR